jgi:serine/threonine protein kinase
MKPGAVVGRYRIVSVLGEGGMGVVYEAEDTRLGRRVALKFLPEGLARDRGALERFEREARAASALNHPHICTIHDVSEADSQPFIAMELLEGQTLKAVLGTRPVASGLPIDELLRIAEQLADALAAAHAKGILHRDIKPANIFLTTRGVAKLLDFGVAKLTSEPHGAETDAPTTAGAWATGAGVTLGTVGYMSPEQVRGEPVDARTDLFSLGVVLYEMATGVTPFRGATAGAVLSDILTKAPTAPVRLNPEVPADLERLVNKLLEKDRALRCQSAADLRADLERLKRAFSGPAASTRRDQASIVVLPFENLSPDPDNAFFADGLTEEIIADLSKVRALRVISRTSAMHYKGTTKPLPAIACELNVHHVLEGSVRRAGNNLRITAQLIEAATDAHLWAEKYSGTLDDVFDLQEQLSRRIVEALSVVLTPDEKRRLGAREAADPRVYEAWLRARHAFHELTPDGFESGARLARQAIETLGEGALLYAALALLDYALYDFGIHPGAETLARAEHHATRALALGPDLAEAHFVTGLVRYKQHELAEAIRALRRSLDLQFNSDAAIYLSGILSGVGMSAEGRRFAQAAAERDPLSAIAYRQESFIDLLDGRSDEAVSRLRESVARHGPLDSIFICIFGMALACAGHETEALEAFDLAAATEGFLWADASRLFALALRGDVDAARALLGRSESMRVMAEADETGSMIVATALGRVGDDERTLQWVGHAVSLGFTNHRFFSEHNPFLARLRGDPRFEALMEKARLKQQALLAELV